MEHEDTSSTNETKRWAEVMLAITNPIAAVLAMFVGAAFVLLIVGIVVGIISDSRPRNQVARTKAYMRSVAMGIESYYLDNNRYPTTRPLADYATRPQHIKSRAGTTPSYDLAALTTPVSYVTPDFPDPFAPQKGMPFAYLCTESTWIMTSPGPDGVYDIVPQKALRLSELSLSPTSTTAMLARLTYDPTNGDASRGDIWRMKQ